MSQQTDTCPQAVWQQIQQAPADTVDLLLRVREVGPVQRTAIEEAGFTIRHQTTLVPYFAISGPVGALESLLDEPWLVSVELDGPVTAMANEQ